MKRCRLPQFLCNSRILSSWAGHNTRIVSSRRKIDLRHRAAFLTIPATAAIDPRHLVSITSDPKLLEKIPLQDVRSVAFIAHIDHGKSSLSSRLLELAGNLGAEAQKIAWQAALENNIPADNDHHTNENKHVNTIHNTKKNNISDKEHIQLLDTLSVERERGITVKASSASMLYYHPTIATGPTGYLLINLYDTPGHADFSQEVARTLQFVDGAVLLLDATRGMQAQTWSVHEQASQKKLLLALTKVDLPNARPDHVALSVAEWLNTEEWLEEGNIYTSARSRIGIKGLLDAICKHIPAPTPLDDDDTTLRAQVVDSWYQEMGVHCLVKILSGKLGEGDRISIVNSKTSQQQQPQSFSVQEVGLMLPHPYRTRVLRRGQMGYIRFGLKDPRQALPGTMLLWTKDMNNKQLLLPEMKHHATKRSVLYASVHPRDADAFAELSNAVERLALNDIGLDVQKTASLGNEGGPFLGPGLRVGFQGLLHVEVFRQRLSDEFGIEAVVTPPKVPYTITFLPSKRTNTKEAYTKVVEDLSEWPQFGDKYKVLEPVVNVKIVARAEDVGPIMELLTRKRGKNLQSQPLDEEKWLFTAIMPWADLVTDFHDQLKNVTAGYGSMDTQEADPPLVEADLHKVEIMLNEETVEPLSFVCHRSETQREGATVCKRLQEVLPRQQFVTVIQAKADGRVVASERIRAYRKDVLTKSGKTVGGGDQTRKMKLLEKQKKGKKRMQQTGRVQLSQEAFNSVISRSN